MKNPSLLLPLASLLVLNAAAQPRIPVPEPEKPQAELRVQVDPAAPLDSFERQVETASFDQRGALATAFDTVNRSVDERVAELNAQGLSLNSAAATNLAEVRDYSRQVFRDMSLSTEETWQTSRHNAVMALRKIRGSLETLKRTATLAGS